LLSNELLEVLAKGDACIFLHGINLSKKLT